MGGKFRKFDFGEFRKFQSLKSKEIKARQVRIRNQGEVEFRNGQVGDFRNGRTVVVQYLDSNPARNKVYLRIKPLFFQFFRTGIPDFLEDRVVCRTLGTVGSLAEKHERTLGEWTFPRNLFGLKLNSRRKSCDL